MHPPVILDVLYPCSLKTQGKHQPLRIISEPLTALLKTNGKRASAFLTEILPLQNQLGFGEHLEQGRAPQFSQVLWLLLEGMPLIIFFSHQQKF